MKNTIFIMCFAQWEVWEGMEPKQIHNNLHNFITFLLLSVSHRIYLLNLTTGSGKHIQITDSAGAL
jgi:hypothetical protein